MIAAAARMAKRQTSKNMHSLRHLEQELHRPYQIPTVVHLRQYKEELNNLGVTSTGITIRDGKVEFLGKAEMAFAFQQEEGVLLLETGNEAENIRIFRLTDEGIAVNWYGLTFYAEKVTE